MFTIIKIIVNAIIQHTTYFISLYDYCLTANVFLSLWLLVNFNNCFIKQLFNIFFTSVFCKSCSQLWAWLLHPGDLIILMMNDPIASLTINHKPNSNFTNTFIRKFVISLPDNYDLSCFFPLWILRSDIYSPCAPTVLVIYFILSCKLNAAEILRIKMTSSARGSLM